jgi:urocanate hydratase
MGMCFGKPEDLVKQMYCLEVLEEMAKTAPEEIQQQMQDIQWIKVQENKLVVGSQARSFMRMRKDA